uniref:Uncharacterized protein n=1 Tax=Physcomitrium patens TaxID=3218 RepID=A0A2K1IB00_PHYPA|nr:hypothetical protein PHYPA_031022 [Physcomitrium patens]
MLSNLLGLCLPLLCIVHSCMRHLSLHCQILNSSQVDQFMSTLNFNDVHNLLFQAVNDSGLAGHVKM